MTRKGHILVIGAGIFGVTGALALRERGYRVTLADPGSIPHALAASTDISKLVRPDYGSDDLYTDAMLTALAGWRRWNAAAGEPLFRQTGLLVLSRKPLLPGSFEYESQVALARRGVATSRMSGEELVACYPQWRRGRFVDGYLNPQAGWADSGRVVAWLVEQARSAGVELRAGWRVEALEERAGRVIAGVGGGERVEADWVVVAAGAWTAALVPELSERLRAVGQPVFHLEPERPERFEAESFPPWCADIAETGWYGFALHRSGVVKVANHGVGRLVDPDEARLVNEDEEDACRAFLCDALPELARAQVVRRRLCLYCDSADGDFWIARHPERSGLVIAAGGSGHAFKFAPMLGAWIADAVEGRERPELARFGWRDVAGGGEAARAGSAASP